MDGFLRKHNVDVGRTAGVLLFAWAVAGAYDVFFGLLYGGRVMVGIGIPILLALASGMCRHDESSRCWCVGLTWLAGAGIVVGTVVLSFTPGVSAMATGKEFPDVPVWKLIVTGLALLPAFWVIIRALGSAKAKEEFGVVEQRPTDAASRAAPSPGSGVPDA